MVAVGDPVGSGFVPSLARPGGNITGVSNNDVGLAAKRLALLKEVLPKLSLVAALRNPTSSSGELQFRETQAAARSLGIEIQLVEVRDPKELESGFAAMVKGRAGAFTVMGDPLFLSQQKQIATLALAKRVPSVFTRGENVEAGGLMSYGAPAAQFRQVVTYVQILKGAKTCGPAVEQPTKFEFVINPENAKALA
jgi:putative ABC transport system substrate-binding protein